MKRWRDPAASLPRAGGVEVDEVISGCLKSCGVHHPAHLYLATKAQAQAEAQARNSRLSQLRLEFQFWLPFWAPLSKRGRSHIARIAGLTTGVQALPSGGCVEGWRRRITEREDADITDRHQAQ